MTDVFRLHRLALRCFGVTFPGDREGRRWLAILADFYLIFSQVCSVAWMVLLFVGAYRYTFDDFMNRVVAVTAGVSVLGSVVKFCIFRLRSGQLEELLDEMADLECDTPRGKLVMKVIKFYVFCVLMIIVTHNLHPLYEEFHRTTPYYTQKPGGPWQEVLRDFVFSLYSACVILPGNVIGDTLFLLLCSQLSHRLHLLAVRISSGHLEESSPRKGQSSSTSGYHLLRACIEEHQRLVRSTHFSRSGFNFSFEQLAVEPVLTYEKYKGMLQEMFSTIILAQLLYSFVDTCFTLFAVSQAENMVQATKELLPQFTSLFLEIFLYCWGGQMINEHFEELHHSFYSSEWYKNHVQEVRASLLIVTTFTAKPVDINAIIFKFNFKFYETICRETFSYYTIMYQLFSQK